MGSRQTHLAGINFPRFTIICIGHRRRILLSIKQICNDVGPTADGAVHNTCWSSAARVAGAQRYQSGMCNCTTGEFTAGEDYGGSAIHWSTSGADARDGGRLVTSEVKVTDIDLLPVQTHAQPSLLRRHVAPRRTRNTYGDFRGIPDACQLRVIEPPKPTLQSDLGPTRE